MGFRAPLIIWLFCVPTSARSYEGFTLKFELYRFDFNNCHWWNEIFFVKCEVPERKLSIGSSASNHSSASLATLTSAANITAAAPPNNPLFRPLNTPEQEPKLVPVEAEASTSTATQTKPPPDETELECPQCPLLSALLSYIDSAVSMLDLTLFTTWLAAIPFKCK